jgi:phosphoglycerol transferase MdoB-like AlkP superfamily enzyme
MIKTPVSRPRENRFNNLILIVLLFVAISLITRIGLLGFSGEWRRLEVTSQLAIISVGFLYDLAALSYVIAAIGLISGLIPGGALGRRLHGAVLTILLPFIIFGIILVAVSEFLFWNEFSARFNFIAVDYLVYTREVIGNIQQSYSLFWIVSAISLLTFAIFLKVAKPFWRNASAEGHHLHSRLRFVLVCSAMPIASFFLVSDEPRLWIKDAAARELAGNGYYDFMRAFRNNDLNFNTFYATMNQEEADRLIREEFEEAQSNARISESTGIMGRVYSADPKREAKLNLILVTMESMGAEYIEALGGKPNLTPNLNRLASQSLLFSATYATGLRTVRGLEAITLSLPPLPGHAIPVRKDNKGFQTLGSVLRSKGYDTIYLYGGYSQFDNMKDFFGGNGYEVIDRTHIPQSQISHETIWGVADEDLLNHALQVFESRARSGKRFFGHVMTTSNHRPFTYPQNRIDIPSGTGRDGAVKYADWAIGDFLSKASTYAWFKDTIFVFVADHTSLGRGKVDLEPGNFHIPFFIFSPQHIRPERINSLSSQIDVAPTVLALMGTGYKSYFLGQNILTEGRHHERAFLGNYLTVGYLEKERLVQLAPNRRKTVIDLGTYQELNSKDGEPQKLIEEAIAHYQFTTKWLELRPRN